MALALTVLIETPFFRRTRKLSSQSVRPSPWAPEVLSLPLSLNLGLALLEYSQLAMQNVLTKVRHFKISFTQSH